GNRERIGEVASSARTIAAEESAPVESRAAAISLLGLDFGADSKEMLFELLDLLANAQGFQIQGAAADALVSLNALKEIESGWGHLTPSARRVVISAALKRPEIIRDFLEGLKRNGSLSEISIAQR